MSDAETAGRPNQRRRTRKDLLEAAGRLTSQGKRPTLEDVAEEALVSRATAYRYFPSIEALLIEAAVHIAFPPVEVVFGDGAPLDPVLRLECADNAIDKMIFANEASIRLMLAQSLEQSVRADQQGVPPRQNRRTPMIEAALEPTKKQFKPADFDKLSKALALVIGPEGMIALKDVLQLDEAEARSVKRWAIRALVDAAKKTGA